MLLEEKTGTGRLGVVVESRPVYDESEAWRGGGRVGSLASTSAITSAFPSRFVERRRKEDVRFSKLGGWYGFEEEESRAGFVRRGFFG